MKIYTKTGDKGETGLFGGDRVSKGSLRVEAYGNVDEINARLGWASTLLAHLPLEEEIRRIQSELFVLGANLATAPGAPSAAKERSAPIGQPEVRRLESLIDGWEADLKPLRNFILPGGAPGAAALQMCRTACRQAERSVVRLASEEAVNPDVIIYLNRLSDLLFVLARWVNFKEGIEEPLWKPRQA